ncbi:hypothetical protein KSP40_PGU006333 [Platanthera guangdongensis]|uniref:Uncharacterized protein n=1 Tax=Platanthera guangdongensis TaxID=2320717 RepID=A0ABR2LRH3_9ASPA
MSFSPGTSFSKNNRSSLLIKWDGRPLDVERIKLSLEHVRALNTQFVSWVQSQLQNHLDELWIDGVKDYLSHASNIWQGIRALGLKFGRPRGGEILSGLFGAQTIASSMRG